MARCESFKLDLANADELAALYRNLTSTNTTFIQLSSGPSQLEARTLELDRMSVTWVTAMGHHFWHDVMVDGGWRFAFAIDAQGTLRLNGHDLSLEDAQLLRSGEENIFVTDGAYSTLEITLEGSLIRELGWRSSALQLQQIKKSDLSNLQALCEAAYSNVLVTAESANDLHDVCTTCDWQDILLSQLEKTLRPWLISVDEERDVKRIHNSFRIVQKAREHIFEQNGESLSSIDTLTDLLGVSRRTLFAAFKKELGLGPYKLIELKRLNALRNRLLQSDPDGATVAGLSNEAGFSELGRTAVAYRKLFGELPSKTLRRSA